MSPSGYVELDWYETPRYYDIVFDQDTAKEADFLVEMLSRFDRVRGRRVLEPACGSGRLVAELASRGFEVTGFDASPAMLAYARKRLARRRLEARLVEARLEDFRLGRGRFDLAHCLVSTFKYLLDEESARAHLACTAKALKIGGIYVLGFHLTDYADRRRNRERWAVRRGGTEVVCNIQGWPADRQKRLERVRTRLVVQERGRELRSETTWKFRTYDARQVRRLLRSVPELEHVATFDFTYALSERNFSDEQLDSVLILRRIRT